MKSSPYNHNLAAVTNDMGSNLYLHQILEETPNGVLVVNLSHQIIYANPAATRFLGIPHRNLQDKGLNTALGKENNDLFNSIVQFFESNKTPDKQRLRQEIQIKTEENGRKFLDTVLVYPPSSPDYYLFYLIDITTRKNLEAKLRRRSTFFYNLIESSVDGIIASDMKGATHYF